MLRIGNSGEEVKQLQLALAKLGYKLNGTGYFGSATDAAVTDFQRRSKLEPDGIAGDLTWKAIAAAQVVDGDDKPVPIAPEVTDPLWVVYGKSLLTIHEGTKKGDLAILGWAKDEGGDIAKNYKKTSIPWCALYVNHLFTKAGLKGTETLWALDWSAGSKKWPNTKLDGPAVGAVAAMKRTGGGHVIVVVGRDQHGNVMGLGGNQSDEVSIRPFPRSRLNQGFGWPVGVPLPNATGFDKLPVVASNGKVSTREA